MSPTARLTTDERMTPDDAGCIRDRTLAADDRMRRMGRIRHTSWCGIEQEVSPRRTLARAFAKTRSRARAKAAVSRELRREAVSSDMRSDIARKRRANRLVLRGVLTEFTREETARDA